MVAPNADHAVIERAAKLGLIAVPGVATMTEAFAALKAGASGLKLFPGEALGPDIVKAWRAVLPKETQLYPVGGVTPERIAPYKRAGASGFGIGSALYKPGASVEEVRARGADVRDRVERERVARLQDQFWRKKASGRMTDGIEGQSSGQRGRNATCCRRLSYVRDPFAHFAGDADDRPRPWLELNLSRGRRGGQ